MARWRHRSSGCIHAWQPQRHDVNRSFVAMSTGRNTRRSFSVTSAVYAPRKKSGFSTRKRAACVSMVLSVARENEER
jgi:hypothetical protein